MSERIMGSVGKLRYEILGGDLKKNDLRRIVWHLLTMCEDFDPGDFERFALPMDAPEHDCTEAHMQAHGQGQEEGLRQGKLDLLAALDVYIEANALAGEGAEDRLYLGIPAMRQWFAEQHAEARKEPAHA